MVKICTLVAGIILVGATWYSPDVERIKPKWDSSETEWQEERGAYDERVEIDQPPEGWHTYKNIEEYKVPSSWPKSAKRRFP